MKKLLNILYVSTSGAYLHLEGETVVIEVEKVRVNQYPLHLIGGIVCFGNVLCSPALLGFCAERDVAVSFLSEYGRFLASVRGPVSGNVLLRRQQYRMADDAEVTQKIATQLVSGKEGTASLCRLPAPGRPGDHGEPVPLGGTQRP